MGFDVKILADSIHAGARITTMSVTYPRIIHCEMLRHRAFSRCASSSRAIPIERMMEQVDTDPYVPEVWEYNKPGMQGDGPMHEWDATRARHEWIVASKWAVQRAHALNVFGVHKQWVNRLLEPFQWLTEVITATEWDNFFHLRIHPAAQPDIRKIATMMRDAMDASTPEEVGHDGEHLPMLSEEEKKHPDSALAAIGRVARVSYLRHDDASNFDNDVARAKKMLENGHMSPFEHVAFPAYWGRGYFCSNFRGWYSYRWTIPGQEDMLKPKEDTSESE